MPVPTARPNRPPSGEFRFTPPAEGDGAIHIGIGVALNVNAHFQDPDGDPMTLTVYWGDGDSNHIKCGLCRLHHEYVRFGRKDLRAEITDYQATVRTWATVIVE